MEGADGLGTIDIPHPVPSVDSLPQIDAGRGLDGPIVFGAALTEINDCEVVVSSEGNELLLANPFDVFADGRRIVVAQMNDAIASSSDSTAPVTSLGRAGEFEIAEIASHVGAQLTLLAPLKIGYETNLFSGYRAQACLVHEWTDVTVQPGATVSPSEWDGMKGGILAAEISGTLFVDAGSHLSADASGFRGGFCGSSSSASNVTGNDVVEGQGGGKGEGLDARFFVDYFGRGAVANAGGGGNGLNAGGGGGGGAGEGGEGGRQKGSVTTVVFGDATHGYAGGRVIDTTRLVFGGGGGAGHLDGLSLDTCGGAGGGAIILRANALAGTGAITANGANGARVDRSGGGGGGAGGTIDVITASSTLFAGMITADGGRGGNVDNHSTTTVYGAGGGGGGGTIRGTGLSPSYGIRAKGGRAGMNEDTFDSNSWGGRDGDDGAVTLQ